MYWQLGNIIFVSGYSIIPLSTKNRSAKYRNNIKNYPNKCTENLRIERDALRRKKKKIQLNEAEKLKLEYRKNVRDKMRAQFAKTKEEDEAREIQTFVKALENLVRK